MRDVPLQPVLRRPAHARRDARGAGGALGGLRGPRVALQRAEQGLGDARGHLLALVHELHEDVADAQLQVLGERRLGEREEPGEELGHDIVRGRQVAHQQGALDRAEALDQVHGLGVLLVRGCRGARGDLV